MTKFSGELLDSASEESTFWVQFRQFERAVVGGSGVGGLAEAAQEIGAGGVRQAVIPQIAAREDGVDQRQAGGWTAPHRDVYRPVQLDHRGRVGAREDVVESDDLVPVGGAGVGRA